MWRIYLSFVTGMLLGCDDEKSSPPRAQDAPQLAVKELRKLPGIESTEFWSASIPADARTLFLSDNGQGIRAFDLTTSKEIQSLPTFISVTALAISPDGKQVLVNRGAGEKTGPILIDLGTRQALRTFDGQKEAITFVAFTPNEANVLAAAEDIRIWSKETGKEVQRHPLDEKERVRAAVSIDGRPVVAVVKHRENEKPDTSVRVLDLDNKKELFRFAGPQCNRIDSLALVPKDDVVVILYSRMANSLGGLGPPGWHAFLQVRRMSDGKEMFDAGLDYCSTSIAVYPDQSRFLLAGRNVYEWQLRDK